MSLTHDTLLLGVACEHQLFSSIAEWTVVEHRRARLRMIPDTIIIINTY